MQSKSIITIFPIALSHFMTPGSLRGDAVPATFTGSGADNNWHTAANWNPANVPAGDACVIIPASSGLIRVDKHTGFAELTIGPGSEIQIQPSFGIFPLDVIENNGLISFMEAGLPRIQTQLDTSMTLNGSGVLRIAKTDTNPILWGQNGTNTFTNGPDHTIEGHGYLTESIERLVNSGLINANVEGQTLRAIDNLVLDLDGGELRAESGGTLRINNSDITGSNGGFISVGDDSAVILGSLELSSTEIKAADLDGDLSNNLLSVGAGIGMSNVTNAARIEVTDASNTRNITMLNSFVNNGEIIALDETPTGSTGIRLDGDVTLSGSGKVVLNDSQNHYITGLSVDDTFVHGENHTIEGQGIVGSAVAILGHFLNSGIIHSNQGGELSIRARDEADAFINEPSGILRVTNSSTMTMPPASTVGLHWKNRGTIEVQENCVFDAARNPTLGNLRPNNLDMESGKLHVDGDFDTDLLNVSSGIISGSGITRAAATILAENVVIRPGDDGTPGIGVLTFGDSLPTDLTDYCNGVSTVAERSDVVQFGGSTLEFDLESATSHDAIRFGTPGRETGVHGSGSVRLKLNLTGPPSGFNSDDQIVIVSDIAFTAIYQFGGPGQFTRECNGSTALVHPETHGGLTVANLNENGDLTTYDGRATFKVILEPTSTMPEGVASRIILTQPFFATELPGEDYSFRAHPGSGTGTVVAAINAPGGLTGTPTFAIIGDTPFQIDAQTGEISVAEALSGNPTIHRFTVNIYDGENVQSNLVSLYLGGDDGEVAQLLLNGSGGPFEGQDNPEIVSPEADPDKDGICNVFELWYGTNPDIPNPSPEIELGSMMQDGMPTGVVSVSVDSMIDDLISIDCGFSTDLRTFEAGIRGSINPGPMRRIQFIDPNPTARGKFFSRFSFISGGNQ